MTIMFGFWQSEPRPVKEGLEIAPLCDKPPVATIDPSVKPTVKRKASCGGDEDDDSLTKVAPTKRAKREQDCTPTGPRVASASPSRDELCFLVEHEFSTEILLKHNEKRLIDQELAKCQIALEQLRRCHLIPYPVNCPTPEQMLAISNGNGPALQSRPNEPVPAWAPPFGVLDGPYARHYAKWLIPHEKFDGVLPEWHGAADLPRSKAAFAEGRTTRNSYAEPVGGIKSRSGRGTLAPKLHALPSGRSQQKEKAGPCVLKRADGQTVKLVCLDCNREDFSSTQGFINHCRIAHKRDYKSHEEAAVKCGQPFQPLESPLSAATAIEERTPVQPAPPLVAKSGSAHPLASSQDQNVYSALLSRIHSTLALYKQGQVPDATQSTSSRNNSKTTNAGKPNDHQPSPRAPYLSQLLHLRNIGGDLDELVRAATTVEPQDDFTLGEESDEDSAAETPRARVVMRIPAKSTTTPIASAAHPAISKGRIPPKSIPGQKRSAFEVISDSTPLVTPDEDVEMEEPSLSPSTLISNNAPSLVSDDGEYDDSDEGSSVSGQSEAMDADAVSDIAEINLDEDHDHRGLRRTSTGAPVSVRLQKDDPKHVSFVGPVANGNRDRRTRKP